MAISLRDYAKKLGIEVPGATAKAIDVEAGKAGYEKYLADVEAATTARNNAIEAEKSKQTWWDKASSIILQANGMSSTMTNDPISTGFNQAVAAYKSIPDDYNSKPTDDWTDDERWAFGEKYAASADDAYAFAKDLNTRKAQEKKRKAQENIENWSSRNAVNGVLASGASLGLNTIYGGLGYLDALAQKSAGKEIEQNILLPHEAAGAMQGAVAEKLNKWGTLNENIPVLGGKGWGDVYGLGMSIAQSRIAVASGSQAYTLAMFFGMSASQGVTDALSRGANGDQAIAYGTIAGLAEAIPEMISVDKLLGIESKEGVQNLFKNILKQAGEEAGEEFTTSVINEVADRWIMGGKSNYQLRVNELVASGMSLEQAQNRAWIQTIEDIAFDTISGAASGAISGGISTGKNRINQQFLETEKNDAAKEKLAPKQAELLEEAKQYDSTKKRATALEKKVANGKELSGYDLRMLKSQVNEASRAKDVDTVRKAIVDKMKAEGVSESQAKVLGEIALNKAIGNDVSKVQELMLKRNAAANKVYNQISAEVMESGIGDSEWATKTPIERLRFEKQLTDALSGKGTVQTQTKSDATFNQVKGKYTEVDGKITYKTSGENSRLHIDGITSSLTSNDIIELSAVEKIANALGVDVHVYETTVNEKGERTYTDKSGKKLSDSGYYDPNDNSIHIDLRAGDKGEGTMLYTASHEVVHFIKENAAEHYEALEELVTKALIKGGFSMEKAIEEQRKKAIENGQTLTDEQLREEVIAEACQSFLASKNAVAEIQALKSENKGLWTALKKFFTSFFNKINKLYKETPPDAPEGKYIADLHKSAKKIRDAFLEGAVEAGKKANAKTTTAEKTTAKEVKSQARVTSEQDEGTKVIHGYTLNKNANVNEDLLEELRIYDPSAEVSAEGRITVYHRTSEENADMIRKTGIMRAKEDALFFSSKSEGYASDYGDTVITFKIPSTQLRVNDIFEGEVHFDMPLKRSANGWSANVKNFLVDEGSPFALSERFNEKSKDIRYKVRNIVGGSGKNYGMGVYLDSNLLTNLSDTERVDMVKEYLKELGGSVFTAYDSNNEKVDIHLVESHRKFKNEKGKRVYVNQHLTDYLKNPIKQEAIALVDELILTANYSASEFARHKHDWLDADGKNTWDVWTTYLQDKENTVWKANLQIANSVNGEKILYEVHPIEKVEEIGKPDTTSTTTKIPQTTEKVNTPDENSSKNIRSKSRNIDSNGNVLTEAQSEYFKDSKVRDSDGNLLVVYHGTRKADFTEFKRNINFFTDSEEMADSYSPNGEKHVGYLNITKPLVIDAKGERWSRIPIDAETKAMLDAYGSSSFKEGGKWRSTPADIASAIEEGVDEGEFDYDGIIINNLDDTGSYAKSSKKIIANDYIAFSSSQFKNTTNTAPTKSKDIRHKSRSYTAGQAAAMKANLSHQKVYTKSTAMKFVKAVAPGIKTKAFDELSNELWIGLNTYTSLEDKQAFAKDMADMLVERMLVDTEVKSRKWDEAVEKIAYLKPAVGTIKFREEDLPDLEHMLDKSGLRSLRARWGYKSKEGEHKRAYGLDEFITDLSREMPGMAYLADMHPAEAMVEVDALYRELKATISQRYESAYEDATEEQIESWKSTVEGKILDVYEYYGGMSKLLKAASSTSEAVDIYLGTVPEGTEKPEKYFVDILKQMDERISFWKAEKSKTEQISKWNGVIGNKAAEIRDYKNGAFLNATQYHPDIFKESIEQLTKLTWRGNISPKGVRKIFAELKKWYTMDNPMLYDKSDKENDDDLYSDQIAFYIDILAADADVEKPLAADEYPMIYEVMNHLYTMMKNYGKIFRAGRWIDAAEIAKAYIGIIDENDKKRTALTRAQSLYNRQFLEPMALARQADNYNPYGFFTQTMEELRRASVNASIGEMRLRKQYDEFVDANQKYLMNAAKETVRYRGHDIPRLHLISLYMTMKRKQSREGLALNGFEYTMKTAWWDSEDVIEVPGYLPQSEKYNIDLINSATEAQMAIIAENFTDTDREYIAILEKLFNEELRKLKVERDIERQGYTNALEGYYYPIIRGGIARNIDTAKFTDVNRATNSSFNKRTQQHAEQYLKIISADAMVNRHIKDMCKYYYMSQAIENYNVLYQIDTTEGDPNLNNPRNIAERLKVSKIWEKDFEYFKKLVADIQGIRDNTYDSDGWRLIESLRGNYAKFALGLNAKVLFTQASSIIAAGDVIGFGSLMSLKKNVGLIATKEDIEKYCPIAAVRSYEQTALKAMTLTDKMGKVSEKMMAGISVMDDLVIRRLFAACQVEAKKRGAGDIGTEDNKIVAGKILEQIILETQQNSYATEKSSAMRSANPLWRGLTMFTADGMKIISRIHDAVGEFKLAKKSGNAAEIKAARKHLARSIAVATAISVYMTAIASLFNWIYGRKKKDEEEKPLMKVHNFTTELIGNFIGALPFISDLYDRIVNGFEVEDVFYDSINNLYGSISNLCKDATDMADGKQDRTIEDLNRDLRSLLYAVGQVTGMPVRNVYNLTRGAIGIASPKAGYYIDSKFENTSLVTDLKKAVKEGNNSKTAYIMGLIYDERLDDRVSKEQSEEILRLYEKIGKKEIEGYTVIPKDIPDEIKRDGVTVELTDEQKEKIVSEYSKVISAIDKLISSSFYRAQSDEDRAYLIDYYHDKYYETAVNNALGIKDDKVAVYNAIGFSTYAKFAYVTRGIQSDKDKNGNTIPGSKKAKVTEAIEKASKDENKKLLYLASLGYTLTEEQRKKLCKYLNYLSVSASKKKSLAEACNLTYKNGKISP